MGFLSCDQRFNQSGLTPRQEGCDEANLECLTELDEICGPLVAFGPEDGLLLLGESLFLATDEVAESRDDGITSGLR